MPEIMQGAQYRVRGRLAEAVSQGLMAEPVIFRSHGGRASAIANGSLHIDVAFLGAASADALASSSICSNISNWNASCAPPHA